MDHDKCDALTIEVLGEITGATDSDIYYPTGHNLNNENRTSNMDLK